MNTTCLDSNCGESVMCAGQEASRGDALPIMAARAACALEQSIQRMVRASDQNLGHLEKQAARDVQDLLRQTVERGAQAKADATPPECPACGQKLSRLSDPSSTVRKPILKDFCQFPMFSTYRAGAILKCSAKFCFPMAILPCI